MSRGYVTAVACRRELQSVVNGRDALNERGPCSLRTAIPKCRNYLQQQLTIANVHISGMQLELLACRDICLALSADSKPTFRESPTRCSRTRARSVNYIPANRERKRPAKTRPWDRSLTHPSMYYAWRGVDDSLGRILSREEEFVVVDKGRRAALNASFLMPATYELCHGNCARRVQARYPSPFEAPRSCCGSERNRLFLTILHRVSCETRVSSTFYSRQI